MEHDGIEMQRCVQFRLCLWARRAPSSRMVDLVAIEYGAALASLGKHAICLQKH